MRHMRPEAEIYKRRSIDVIHARGARNFFIDQLAFERLFPFLDERKELAERIQRRFPHFLFAGERHDRFDPMFLRR